MDGFPLTAEVATLWIQNGTADRILEKRRKEAAARQQLAADILADFQLQSTLSLSHLAPPARALASRRLHRAGSEAAGGGNAAERFYRGARATSARGAGLSRSRS